MLCATAAVIKLNMATALTTTVPKTTKRNNLTLKQKHEVIKEAESNPGIGIWKLAGKFECGKTQVLCILKKRDEIEALYSENASLQICQTKGLLNIQM